MNNHGLVIPFSISYNAERFITEGAFAVMHSLETILIPDLRCRKQTRFDMRKAQAQSRSAVL
jgi:hypothetical protein